MGEGRPTGTGQVFVVDVRPAPQLVFPEVGRVLRECSLLDAVRGRDGILEHCHTLRLQPRRHHLDACLAAIRHGCCRRRYHLLHFLNFLEAVGPILVNPSLLVAGGWGHLARVSTIARST